MLHFRNPIIDSIGLLLSNYRVMPQQDNKAHGQSDHDTNHDGIRKMRYAKGVTYSQFCGETSTFPPQFMLRKLTSRTC